MKANSEETGRGCRENFSQLYNSLDVLEEVVFVIDKNLVIEEINETGCRLLQKAKTEIIGRTCKESFSCQVIESSCPFHEVMLTGCSCSSMNALDLLDRRFLAKASPVCNEHGEVEKVVEILFDITEKEAFRESLERQNLEIGAQNEELRLLSEELQAQNEELYLSTLRLKESEERYNSLIINLKSGVVIYQPSEDGTDFIILNLNHAAEKSINLRASEAIGKKLLELFPGLKSTNFFEALHQVNHTGEAVNIPPFYYQDSQRQGWRENFIYKLPCGEIVAIFDDVTELKSSEQRWQKSEERYRLLSSLTFEGILVHRNGFGLDCNDSFTRLTGYSLEEILETNVINLLVASARDRHKINLNLFKSYCKPYVVQFRRKNGSVFYCEIEARNYYINEEKIRIIALRDVSERFKVESVIREREKQLKKQNEEHLKINEMLLETNQRMADLNENLTKANKDLDSFVYSASHDLRAPITSALGLARLIKNTQNFEEISHYAELQEKSLLKLDNFIRDILNYSRNSRISISSESIDFNQMIEEVIAENQYITPDFKIRFIKNIKVEVPFLSDPLRIRIILNNLISNAVKFQNKYQAEPTVRIEVIADPQMAVITVADNGIGIGKDHFNRIFEMFYRATDKSNGSGIGLYITRDCVEKIGGRISFTSEYGQGSEFRVEVPIVL